MKSLIQAVAIAVVLAAPVASFAQSNQPVTRAQVRAELVQVEQAGYTPSRGRDPYYPTDIQAAEARVATQNAQAETTGVGGGVSGTTQTGEHADTTVSSYSPPVRVIGR